MEQQIITILKGVLGAAGFPEHNISTQTAAGQTVFQIETKEQKHFIGMRGETLKAIDHLVKKMAEKQGLVDALFVIDVDGYRARQIKELEQKAIIMAERARSFQYDVELTPMSSYERLIIHSVLAQAPNIKTESRGERRNRGVVIRYIAA